MEAYLDNSATTRCSDRACQLMVDLLTKDYGNPSSLHMKGIEAERFVETAKKKIAKTLRVSEKEIIFTSGGTESNNLAIIGAAMANRRAGNHIITTSIEHASVENPMEFLKEQGFDITYLSVDENGIISLEELEEAVTEQTILVSMMQVNNEIGAIEPVAEAAELIKKKNPATLIHVDAIQSYGKMYIYPKKLGIDMLSVSGHKIHGPKGSGFLWVKEKTKLKPLILGGGQQKGMRSGTENVPAIAGLGEAAEEIYENLDEKRAHLYGLKQRFINGIEKLEGTHVNGKTGEDSAPHIVSVSFEGIRSEVLLHSLEDRGIYVSSGSACSSNNHAGKQKGSKTLRNIHLKENLLDSTLRFSFSVHTTEEEIDYALEVLGELLPVLKKYTRH
ncbi:MULTISPECIES: cysteine desulfurase family protein [unclassified Roseburia]|jgi:cysteine desulfurase|uniref:cysteine desulfurase family protein n=1 Tax=unclassified Roseburia TaxID=2637578 RepID=UPI000E42DF9B|nr:MULTISPECIES: cysteine desulfurase family protein [unclassified Roseburia]RGF46425.1 cysteine desulfurase [Roseburia sp. AF42-8]RHQ41492.1 cysteine desulfurase [Roseburia sp. AF25-25LB]RHQ44328.1 cysteine desulfurase [Roseburia sp. AF25-18LB]RHQ51500.1 cysteine desulfurase [Roseburia sp. AF25-15LB]RHQ52609.1 cysteine desulfurase [Roseburia sp. AF25-13LB]